MESVFLTKRNGLTQKYQIPKQNKFLDQLCSLSPRLTHCKSSMVHEQVSLARNMSTTDLAAHIAEVCASLSVRHWEYGALGGRVVVSMLHRQTAATFIECVLQLKETLSNEFVETCLRNKDELNQMIVDERDFQYDIMGIRTLQRSYLLKVHNVIVERPQYMLMRVAVALHGDNLEMVKQTYKETSKLM